MATEYVRLTNSEKMYGAKNMLHAQLEFLNSMRSYRTFREIRSKEFILKVSLKNRIGELHVLLAKFENYLPKSTYRAEKIKKKKVKKSKKAPRKGKKKR